MNRSDRDRRPKGSLIETLLRGKCALDKEMISNHGIQHNPLTEHIIKLLWKHVVAYLQLFGAVEQTALKVISCCGNLMNMVTIYSVYGVCLHTE